MVRFISIEHTRIGPSELLLAQANHSISRNCDLLERESKLMEDFSPDKTPGLFIHIVVEWQIFRKAGLEAVPSLTLSFKTGRKNSADFLPSTIEAKNSVFRNSEAIVLDD